MGEEEFVVIKMYTHQCKRCGGSWKSENPNPLRCGKCKSPYWGKERKEEIQ